MHERTSGEHGPRAPGADRPLSIEDVSRGMIVRSLDVAPEEVVFVKGIIEASDGVAALFAVSGGALSITAPLDRERDLTELLADIELELRGRSSEVYAASVANPDGAASSPSRAAGHAASPATSPAAANPPRARGRRADG